MKIRKFLSIVLFLFATVAGARELVGNVRKTFTITVQGLRKDMNYIQRRSELQMARNTDFCRGSLMPKATKDWSCKGVGPGVQKCELLYRCRSVSRQFNRKSESQRLRNELKGLSKPGANFKIWVSKKPERNLGRYRVSKGNVLSPRTAAKPTRRPAPKKIAKSTKVIEEENYDDLEDFEEDIASRNATTDEEELAALTETEDGNLSGDEEDDLSELRGEDEDQPWKIEKKKSTDGDEEVFRVVKKERRKSANEIKPFQWLSFSGAFIRVSDDLDNSLAAFEGAWTPHYRINSNWEIRGNLGIHSFKLAAADITQDDETFFVYDFGASLIYRFSRIYLEGSFGIQKWNNELADSLSTLGFTVGYKFKNYKFKYVDRVFFSLGSAGNDLRSNSEMRIGFGVSF